MFICIDTNQCAGHGKTLDEAFKDYQEYHDNDEIGECTFFEAEEIKVEVKIHRVESIIKAPAKRA